MVFMGFDLFVHRIRDDGSATYSRKTAEEIFDRGALNPSCLSYVAYPDGHGEIYCGSDADAIDGFMLSHFRGDTVCERVLEIAAVTQSAIFWPGGPISMAVTHREVIIRMPLDVRAEAGEIALVSSVEELWAAINREG